MTLQCPSQPSPKASRRVSFLAGLCLAAASAWWASAQPLASTGSGPLKATPPTGPEPKTPLMEGRQRPPPDRRLREGTVLTDVWGCFKATGDRITFVANTGNLTLVALENLNLERIARAVADTPAQLEWKVTGTVTEYGGANFLLVERAILKPRTHANANH